MTRQLLGGTLAYATRTPERSPCLRLCRSRRWSRLLAFLCCGVLAGAVPVAVTAVGSARAGSDGFGSAGKVVTGYTGSAAPSAVVIQPDGKIVVAGGVALKVGKTNRWRFGFAVARYTHAGRLDKSFGTGGKVVTDFGVVTDVGGQGYVSAVTLQRDGKIIVGGSLCVVASDWAPCDLVLVRYERDGRVDKTFGSAGRVAPTFADLAAVGRGKADNRVGFGKSAARMVTVQPGGKILAGGDSVLARYTRAGQVDRTFGTNGRALLMGSGAEAMVAASDGKILATGWSFELARYTPDGKRDARFGTGGIVRATFGPESEVQSKALVVQEDGKIVVAGSDADTFALARYTGAGKVDNSFGKRGTVQTRLAPCCQNAYAWALALQSDGKIVVAGNLETNDGHFRFAIARYTEAGMFDSTFGGRGKVFTSFGSRNDSDARAVVIQRDGKIVVVGTTARRTGAGYTGPSMFALARYTQGGRLDS